MKSKKTRTALTVLFLSLGMGLTGCSATELEERCFPLLVSVGYEDGKVNYGAAFPKDDATGQADVQISQINMSEVSDVDFAASKNKYEGRLNKQADYNHLKVLVLEDELIEEKGVYDAIISTLMQSEAYPRNTYVCIADDVEELYELEKYIAQDLGTYLEEYIKKHEEGKRALITLGDLMDERANETSKLYIPYLDAEDKYIEWKGYMNTLGKTW